MQSPTPQHLTVVLPTYNRREQLRRCLEGLLRCRLDGLDVTVLVIDDGSSDGTAEVVSRAAGECPPGMRLRHCPQQNQGPAAARNLGIELAETAQVLFLDDDCVPEPEWLQVLAAGPWTEDVGGIGGRIVSAEPSTWISRYCRHIGFNEYAPREEPIRYVNTANCAYSRRALLEVGGLERLFRAAGGEDVDLALRIYRKGYRLLYAPDAVVRHYHRETLRVLRRTFFIRGCSATLREVLWGNPGAATWKRVAVETLRLVLSLRQLLMLPLAAFALHRKGVPARDALPFAFLDWVRAAGMRCGKIAMMSRILTGRQSLERSARPLEAERTAHAAAAGS